MKKASVLSAQGVCEWKMKVMLLCVQLVGRCKALSMCSVGQSSSSLGSDGVPTGLYTGQDRAQERDRPFKRNFAQVQELGNSVQSNISYFAAVQALTVSYSSPSLEEAVESALATNAAYGLFFKDLRMARNGCTHVAECFARYQSVEEAESVNDLEAVSQCTACRFLESWAAHAIPQFRVTAPQTHRYLFFFYFANKNRFSNHFACMSNVSTPGRMCVGVIQHRQAMELYQKSDFFFG